MFYIPPLNPNNPGNTVVTCCQIPGCVNPVCIYSYVCVGMSCGISANSELKQRERTSLGYLALLTVDLMYKQYATKHTVHSICCIYYVHSNVKGVSKLVGDIDMKLEFIQYEVMLT